MSLLGTVAGALFQVRATRRPRGFCGVVVLAMIAAPSSAQSEAQEIRSSSCVAEDAALRSVVRRELASFRSSLSANASLLKRDIAGVRRSATVGELDVKDVEALFLDLANYQASTRTLWTAGRDAVVATAMSLLYEGDCPITSPNLLFGGLGHLDSYRRVALVAIRKEEARIQRSLCKLIDAAREKSSVDLAIHFDFGFAINDDVVAFNWPVIVLTPALTPSIDVAMSLYSSFDDLRFEFVAGTCSADSVRVASVSGLVEVVPVDERYTVSIGGEAAQLVSGNYLVASVGVWNGVFFSGERVGLGQY